MTDDLINLERGYGQYYEKRGTILMADSDALDTLLEGVDTWNSRKKSLKRNDQLDLSRATLSGRNLFGANLNGVNLAATDLSMAHLGTASLRGANLTRADLRGANLRHADLAAANLAYADFQDADLQGAYLGDRDRLAPNSLIIDPMEATRETPPPSSETSREGSGSRTEPYKGAYLVGANLRDANLRHAVLAGTTLTRSDLQDADLHGSYLAADFTEANLRGTDLTRSRIEPHLNNFENATYDAHTQCPDAFDPLSTGANFVSDDEAQPNSLRDIAETLTAYVGVPALLLYPLGLFVLALQLHYDNDIAMKFVPAWYAVSLIGNVMIAGHGARAFLGPLVIAVVVSLSIAKLLWWLRRRKSVSAWLLGFFRKIQDMADWAVLVALGIGAALPITVITLALADILNTSNLFVWVMSGLGGLFGGIVISYDHLRSRHLQEMRLTRGVAERWVLRGLVLAYGVGIFAALLTALIVESKVLPKVSIRATGDGSSYSLDGLLLTHTEQHWHVLVPEIREFWVAE